MVYCQSWSDPEGISQYLCATVLAQGQSPFSFVWKILFHYSRVFISSKTIWDRIFRGKLKIYSFCFTADFYGQECLLLPYFTVIPERLVILILTVVFPFEGISQFKWNYLHFYHSENSGRLQQSAASLFFLSNVFVGFIFFFSSAKAFPLYIIYEQFIHTLELHLQQLKQNCLHTAVENTAKTWFFSNYNWE